MAESRGMLPIFGIFTILFALQADMASSFDIILPPPGAPQIGVSVRWSVSAPGLNQTANVTMIGRPVVNDYLTIGFYINNTLTPVAFIDCYDINGTMDLSVTKNGTMTSHVSVLDPALINVNVSAENDSNVCRFQVNVLNLLPPNGFNATIFIQGGNVTASGEKVMMFNFTAPAPLDATFLEVWNQLPTTQRVTAAATTGAGGNATTAGGNATTTVASRNGGVLASWASLWSLTWLLVSSIVGASYR